MPELLNYWYEQHAYHKILPSEFNLSTRISQEEPCADLRLLPCILNFRCAIIFVKENFMSDHKVFCAKLKQELPGLDEPPFDSELGQRIYDHVSQQAWSQWMEFCKMLLNEYRLNPARKQDQEVIVKQMEQFFFGEGAAPPAEYVPPAH